MNWSNVRLIFLRELRDQLRDRRTMFTVLVLPLLLYPLLGMTFLQVAQFMEEHPTWIWIVGAEHLPGEPQLIKDGQFAEEFCLLKESRLLTLDAERAASLELADAIEQLAARDDLSPRDAQHARLRQVVQQELVAHKYDVLVYIPPDFARSLEDARRPSRASTSSDGDAGKEADVAQVPRLKIFVNTASDKSRIAQVRVERVLDRWRNAIVEKNLQDNDIPIVAAQPFRMVDTDVAADVSRRAAVWSKILPFIVLVWALTGAFYPAVDLCAGEKERGTLETLLSIPAERSEIVWGKLLTVMTFSMSTSLLNLFSIGITGALLTQVIPHGQMPIGPPPMISVVWLIPALVPISALFSAVSLAIAAFARSSKEGQYYLLPVLMVTLPLMMLPILPATELDLGKSLIPVAGMMFLLRALIEGEYIEALRYCVPVLGVTALCCLLAIRWAINQFNDESVLFRETEKFGLGIWMRHLARDREDTPNFVEAFLCGVLILLFRFFAGVFMPPIENWSSFFVSTLTIQIAFIAAPAVLMAIMLTRNPRKTLLLSKPPLLALPAGLLLALLIHPLGMAVAQGVEWLYPMGEETKLQLQGLQQFLAQAPSLWMVLLVLALTPAICEELAFRGFILSGLQHHGHKWAAIAISSVFFGAAHFLLQQSLTACALGFVIGYIAVQTRSLWPGVLFHLAYNGLSVLLSQVTPELVDQYPLLELLFRRAGDGFIYHWHTVVVGGLLACGVLWWLWRLPQTTQSRKGLQPAVDHAKVGAAAK